MFKQLPWLAIFSVNVRLVESSPHKFTSLKPAPELSNPDISYSSVPNVTVMLAFVPAALNSTKFEHAELTSDNNVAFGHTNTPELELELFRYIVCGSFTPFVSLKFTAMCVLFASIVTF